ncbi:Ig-like domain-containing protein [Leifsonia aquatica]|uniref:Ig-like domain-containing protein n=1 Tax=Leifsonia aquatica TaxID=144185 RepID=UPI0037F59F9B
MASGDQVKWSIPYTVETPGNISLVATLPIGSSFNLATISVCVEGSTISPDGRTATCLVAPSTTGSGVWNILAKVTGGNGQTVVLHAVASGRQADSPTTTLLASPQYNFQTASSQKSAAAGVDLVFGYQLWIPVDPQFGLRGREPLASPLTFTIDAESLPDGWSIDNCNASTTSGIVPGRSGGGTNSVTNSGTATCSISGSTVSVSVAGADTTALSYPALSVNGSALPVDRAYVVSAAVSFLIPSTSLPAGTSSYQLQVRDFDPQSTSGQSNWASGYAAGMEPAAPAVDGLNSQSFTVNNVPSGGVAVGFYWNPPGQPTSPLPGWRNTYSGSNPMYAGEPFTFRQQIQNNSPTNTSLTNATGCLAWDPSTANATGEAIPSAQPAYPISVEYGVLAGSPSTQLNSCGREGDGAQNWYSSIADVPGGLSAVSAVRYLVEVPLPAGGPFPYPILIPMQRTASALANGTAIPFAQYLFADGFTAPIKSAVAQTAMDGQLSNTVSAKLSTLAPAATTTVTIRPRITNPYLESVPVAISGTVETVTLSRGLSYLNGSSSLAPSSATTDASGNTILAFDLGTVNSSADPAPIIFDVQAATDVVMPQSESITSVISAPGNLDPLTVRTATASLAINAPQQFGFAKSASATVIQPGDSVTYTIADFNTLANPVGPYAAVDVLPFNGDVNGTAKLTSFRVTELTVTEGISVFFTTDAPVDVRTAVQQDINTADVEWQPYTGGDLPLNVTAIKTTAETVAPNAIGSLRITLGDIDALPNAILGNSITALYAQNGTTVPVTDASAVKTTYLSSSLSGEVYEDLDHNGSLSSSDSPHANQTVTLSGYSLGSSGTDQGGAGTNIPVPPGVTATTRSDGQYTFPRLPAGVYTVTATTPDESKSNGDVISQVAVAEGVKVTGQNIGFYKIADAPVAHPDTATIPEKNPTALDVLANDTGVAISLDTTTPPSATAGATAAYIDGKLIVTPDGHAWADGELAYTTSISYSIDGVYGLRASSTATVTIVRVPQLSDDAATTGSGRPVAIDVLQNDLGTGLTITSVGASLNGTTRIADGKIVFEPNMLNFGNFTTSFTYTAHDALGQTATGTVTVTVVGRPVAGDDIAVTGQGVPVTTPVLVNDSGSDLRVTAVTANPNGSSTINPDGTITFTPAPTFTGKNDIVYTVTDSVGQTSTATLRVSVVATPIARPDSGSVPEAGTITVPVIDNDSGDGIAVTSIVAATKNVTIPGGEAVLDSGGTITFTAAAGYAGTVVFDYTITDEIGQTAQSTLTVIVVAPPTATDVSATTTQDVPVNIDLATSSAGVGVKVTGVGPSTDGTVILNADGTITFTPAEGFTGGTSFTYTLTDAVGQTATGTITITVTVATGPTPPITTTPPTTTPKNKDGSGLAGTGSNVTGIGLLAVTLLTLGTTVVALVRRRRERH